MVVYIIKLNCDKPLYQIVRSLGAFMGYCSLFYPYTWASGGPMQEFHAIGFIRPRSACIISYTHSQASIIDPLRSYTRMFELKEISSKSLSKTIQNQKPSSNRP